LPPGEHAGRLKKIETAAHALLELLDAEDGHLPTWVGPLLRELGGCQISLPSLVSGLRELGDVAGRLAREEAARTKCGRGGATRKGAGPEETLHRELFRIYADFRDRFPESGPAIGFGGPLQRFVAAVHGTLGIQPPSDRVVKSALDRWRKGVCSNQSKNRD
jgi:hypothetical protein